jgi:hypothetical protein
MKTSFFLCTLVFLGSVAACGDTPGAESPPPATSVLTVHATQRAPFQIVGVDTLSDSAQIVQFIPEQDGDGVIVMFADPVRRISRGLAIVDRRMDHPQLLWPDSVTGAWWTGPHRLAFTTTTGQGIRLVVDVHAATLKIADTTSTGLGAPASAAAADSSVVQRARGYIDSLHVQPGGASRGAALVYSVTRVVPSPDGSLAAFHSAARDATGSLTNPAWFVLDRSSGGVTSVDQITGPASELPSDAGAWGSNSVFFYAKGRAIWEAEIQRSPVRPAS